VPSTSCSEHEHSLGGAVERLDHAAVVDDDNRVGRRLKNRCKTQAVFEQLLFELSNRHEFLKVLQRRGKRLKTRG
jgi:hypothetical protein